MKLARVTGSLWATKKSDSLKEYKLMTVELEPPFSGNRRLIIAVDTLGAGIGERVLISCGSSAHAGGINPSAPVDAAIVAIIDEKKK
ncbi:ethanolamine utilization protein EutN [Peptostreptococcaceae bacterium pGA-8]|nr:ethanolamine utilization protein EutN [Peptostreptococcaceae bacterium pGA-8]